MAKTELTKQIELALQKWNPNSYGGYRTDSFRKGIDALEVPVENGTIKGGLIDFVRVQECFVQENKTEKCKLERLLDNGCEFTPPNIQQWAREADCPKDTTTPDFCKGTCTNKFCKYHKTNHDYEIDTVITCVEIKISVSDFHSKHGHNMVGHCNYYALPAEMYSKVKAEIPNDIGILLYLSNGTIRKNVECEPKVLSEKEQKQLIFSATKRFAKAKKEEVLKLEIEAIKNENAWSAQKGIGCKPFDDA